MNMEMLLYVVLAVLVVLYLVWMWKLASGSFHKWSEADRRANELSRSVLSSAQYDQLTRNGYLDIPSTRDAGCVYRVPRAQGLVKVIEQGRLKMSLCLQPGEIVPDADHVVTLRSYSRSAASRSARATRVCGENRRPVGGAIAPTTGT